jgi:hypothetical protein
MFFNQESDYEANGLALASLSIAKAAISAYLLLNISLDNAHFLQASIKFGKQDLYELFAEAMLFLQTTGKSRKLGPAQSPKVSIIEESFAAEDVSVHDAVASEHVGTMIMGKKRKAFCPSAQSAQSAIVPTCTTHVRRSSRCNKYDGFKSNNFSDTKAAKSKVKPRKTHVIYVSVTKDFSAPTKVDDVRLVTTDPVGSTPIPVLQSIGINLCGVPPEELSPKKLLAKP